MASPANSPVNGHASRPVQRNTHPHNLYPAVRVPHHNPPRHSGFANDTCGRANHENVYRHNAHAHYTANALQQPQKMSAVAIPGKYPNVSAKTGGSVSSEIQQHSRAEPPLDYEVLLLSLAEEYFAAAHSQSQSRAIAKESQNQHYYSLVATGLGCLETVLKSFNLAPEKEATVRLRYVNILYEETENTFEAEEAINKGISIAERHRLFDLKYNMQHLLARMLFRTNPRAAFKYLDKVTIDVESYQHIAWIYAFHLLRAFLHLELSSTQDATAAISSFRTVASLATEYGDKSICAIAYALEALACLRHSYDRESFEQAQRALAGVRSLQLDPKVAELPHLSLIVAFVDLSCYLQHFDPAQALQKMQIMQSVLTRVGECQAWTDDGSFAIQLPRSRMASCRSRTGIIREEEDGSLALNFNWIPKDDISNLGYFLAAMAIAHRNTGDGQKSEQMLRDGIRREKHAQMESRRTPRSLVTASSLQKWREQLTCFMRVQLALTLCARTSWLAAKEQLSELNSAFASWSDAPIPLHPLTRYLSGVISHGMGDLPSALAIYRDYPATLQIPTNIQHSSQYMRDIAILSTLNTLLIIRSPSHPLHHHHPTLLQTLTKMCVHHINRQMQAAYHLLAATLPTSSTILLTKQSLQSALQAAKSSENNQLMCIVLNLMSWKFFRGVVGEQAEKSARASQTLAKKGGNALWMSVSAGVLAETLDAAGRGEEAAAARNEGFLRAEEVPDKVREIMFEIGEQSDVMMTDA